jgi:3-keto-disaccharide hydrolase
MKKMRLLGLAALAAIAVPSFTFGQAPMKWKIHDMDRPVPPIITPGTPSTQDAPGQAPSDAVVLFNGKDLSNWLQDDGSAAKWKVENGYAEVVAKTGGIHTKQPFGDCQLHVEFSEPTPPHGDSQERGNSGVFLMGLYEVQVLDSYENRTYADGQASALYGQYPPLVNAALPPGRWQTYDIVFHGARFDASGKLLRPARVTVFDNGVLVQDNVELTGPTAHHQRPPYKPTPEKLPLGLQDHGDPVRYRNIWIRELKDSGNS